MDKLYIVYVDDQREVLSTLAKDLQVFESHISLEECESANEALELIDDIDNDGDHLAVVISDHIMPGKSGVDFLIELANDGRFNKTKKMMLTGQATHKDTITAINQANIEKYLEKPWKSEEIIQAVKVLITQFVFDKGIDYEPLMPVLDQPTLLNQLKSRM